MNALAEAVWQDHPCDMDSCDVAIALGAGYVFSAADLLMGASPSTPAIDAVRARDVEAFQDSIIGEFDQWQQWYLANTYECPACETRVKLESDCGNCGAGV